MITAEDLAGLEDAEFEELEREVARLRAAWEIKNLRGQAAIFHDDQHLGEKRRELRALGHPSADAEVLMKAPPPVVDSLEGNSLIHPLTTPIIEVDENSARARAVWWSIGVEGLSKFREPPMAIISLGIVPGTHVKDDGEWRILSGAWQRTTKNEYNAGWVHSMERTNTRPPLTEEQDRNFLGRYAYRKDTVRQPVPEPPRPDTWTMFPEETDDTWLTLNLDEGS
jgi:hypothetical protein